MADPHLPLIERAYLRRELEIEFKLFEGSNNHAHLKQRLADWQARTDKGETKVQGPFAQRFFQDTWGYAPDGSGVSHTMRDQFPISGAGAGGGTGSADLALGRFGAGSAIPQVVCEYKGTGSDLDKPQARKGSIRSPTEQALNYLRFARRGFFGNEPIQPRFAIVTDMNEFRLYWADTGATQSLRFRIENRGQGELALAGDAQVALTDQTEAGDFERFLFWRLFQPDMLLSEYGRTPLELMIGRQGARQRKLERDFYADYRAFRIRLHDLVKLQPVDGASERDKLRLAQKLLDRFVFVLFAEDMGTRVAFPPNLLRDELTTASLGRFFDPEGTDIWDQMLKQLFAKMDTGGDLGPDTLHAFNGGLFKHDERIEGLSLPNHLFCTRQQGTNEATTATEKRTLLYLSRTYDFAADGDAENAIGLYTLGHIFEQSIVELEKLEADAEGRLSLTEITKRKRDGVYYTPEPIVRRIVEETVGVLLADWRAEAGWADDADPSPGALTAYWDRLTAITVVDPACGSGAFLITALRYLLAEFKRVHELRLAAGLENDRRSDTALTTDILTRNLFGVDINPLSVEIARLSLWLHTAAARRKLDSLNATVRVGNSLVSPDGFRHFGGTDQAAAVRERVCAFDWEAGFPDVFERGGFDAVIGNPPYVKLQNFRRVYEETADYLRGGTDEEGEPTYASTQTGNYDLYLPFIERGLALLNDGGRMGYIAPNLWPTLDYGEGLRGLVRAGRHLDRWIDFRSHQVFEEATIYTALQFYTKAANEAVAVVFARDGDLERVDWTAPDATIPYAELPTDDGAWLFAPAPVRALVERLDATCPKLGDEEVTDAIFQGLITSADYIYHLRRGEDGRFWHQPKTPKGEPKPAEVEVAIEAEIMRPLISGAEAKRFQNPATDTWLLFPYQVEGAKARLWTPDEMAGRFAKAWAYLKSFEDELRARDSHKNDDDEKWYGYIYPKSLDKHDLPKLVVAQTVPAMRVCYDDVGAFYLNNVRVNGILPVDDGWWLLGVMNAPVTDMIFRWLGKPKANGYFEANKQFIAPLPIPRASDADRAEVGRISRALQAGYTDRERQRVALAGRMGRVALRSRPYDWLLHDVRTKAQIEADKPLRLPTRDLKAWVDGQYEIDREAALGRVADAVRPDSALRAQLEDGELMLLCDGAPLCRGVFPKAEHAPFLLAQWRLTALARAGRGDGKRLVDALRKVGTEAPEGVVEQVIERADDLAGLTATLLSLEADLHDITCRLFELTLNERALVEAR